jgi:hypothetical protein
MKTHLIAASLLSLGLLASAASAGNSDNGFCGKGTTYDRENLVCVDNTGAPVTETAGIAVAGDGNQIDNRRVGDFIDETVTERNERSTN